MIKFVTNCLNYIKTCLTNPQKEKTHYLTLLALTILMVLSGTFFSIDDLYNHPQFTEWSVIDHFPKEIDEHGKYVWYYLFFTFDALWAATLLGALYRLLNVMCHKLLPNDKKAELTAKASVLNSLFVLACFAYISDLTEGVLYVTQSFDVLKNWHIVKVKEGLYAITGITFLFGVFKYWSMRPLAGEKGAYKRYHLKSLRVFFSTAYMSILLVLVLILIGGLPQGYTMIVDLIASPINILGTFLLLFLLAVVASHYPAYLEAKKFMNKENMYWHLKPIFKNLPIGIIYYYFLDKDNGTPEAKRDWLKTNRSQGFSRVSKTLRYHLGTAIFVAFLYVLGYAGSSIFDDFWFSKQMAWVVFFLGVWLQNTLSKLEEKQTVRNAVFKYSGFISLSLIAITVGLSASNGYGWSYWALNLSILTTISLMVTYISFRWVRRTLLKDYATDDDVKREKLSVAKEELRSTRVLVSIISKLSLIALAFLFFININLYWAEEHTSAVNVILLFVLNFYGAIVITSKLVLLADTKSYETSGLYSFLKYAAPIFFPALFIFSFFIPELYRSKLHYLGKIPEEPLELITLHKYDSVYELHLNADTAKTKHPIMFTSYGGGLMADVWVMLVTHELQQRTDGDFLKYTYNMSGNSGGGVGIANYTNLTFRNAAHKNDLTHKSWTDAIEKVGEFNHLSLDFTFLLGRDMLRKFIKIENDQTVDRNHYSMSRYAQMTYDYIGDSYKNETFRQYWTKGYRAQDFKYPSITVSATKVHGGGLSNAFSLYTDKHDSIFHGIQNNLDIRNHKSNSSLIFYDAVSLTNRFPILSSAASIGGQGHFIDGGAYDNSGMLNSLELARHSFGPDSANFVNLFNDTFDYIDLIFGDLKETLIKEDASGEISSLLSAGIAIDRTAEHLDAAIRDFSNDRAKIILPKIITYDGVLSYLGGKPLGKDKLHMIMQKVDSINTITMNTLKNAKLHYDLKNWGVVQAPLARLLSKPAYEYEKAMLKHPDVEKQLKKVESWFNKGGE